MTAGWKSWSTALAPTSAGARKLGTMSLEGWGEVVASLIICPTWNRLVIGGLEAPKS